MVDPDELQPKNSDALKEAAPRGETYWTPNITTEAQQRALAAEQVMERMRGVFDKIGKGEDFEPIVFGRQDGQTIMLACTRNPDGSLQLPNLTPPDKKEAKERDRLARKIADTLDKPARKQIGDVIRIALLRKTPEQLKKILGALKKDPKPQLRNRAGCIWLEVGDETVQI